MDTRIIDSRPLDMPPVVEPIGPSAQREVINVTHEYIHLGATLFEINLATIPIRFDLKGKCAGMYRSSGKGKIIRYNPYVFAKYYEDNLRNTVPHEVAHYVAHCIYGKRPIKPHGKEWQNIMHHFHCQPTVTTNYDLTGIPLRRQQTFCYSCECDQHQLSLIRHRKITQHKAQYFCKKCKSILVRKHDDE